ncbi:MAG TPA: PAS domain-containing protein, partial [Planctomycetaceae bacterium]|nr:PAS domain-containing protein [Planctomycetaceae bacterium]
MSDGSPADALRAELAELRDRYEEATATLDAIRTGAVDALIVGGAEGDRVFTLDGADRPYRVLIEAMQQGAATLSADGTILFCNHSLAGMLKTPQEKVNGATLSRFVSAADQSQLQEMLSEGQRSHSRG